VRTVRILEQPATDDPQGYFAVRITEGQRQDTYLVHSVPPDFGEGFSFEKLDAAADFATVEEYDVNLMGAESSCTCKGNTYHGHCRHVESLQALDHAGYLPRVKQKHVACPRCCARVEAPGLCERCTADEEAFAAYLQACEMEAGGIRTGPAGDAESV
jgi:hypothetical protein